MDVSFICELCGGNLGDEHRRPRVLCCGHSFCTSCILEYFKDGIFECFKCRIKHHANSPSQIPVNYHLLAVIVKAKQQATLNSVSQMLSINKNPVQHPVNIDNKRNSNPRSVYPDKRSSNSFKTFEKPRQHDGKCIERNEAYLVWCKMCREWICLDCPLVHHHTARCQIISFPEAIKEIKLEENCSIGRTVKLFKNYFVKCREKIDALRDLNEGHRNSIQDLKRIIAKHQFLDKEIEKQNLNIQGSLVTGISLLLMLLESQSHLLAAGVLKEVLLSRLSAQNCQSTILNWYEPKLVGDTGEISVLEGKGTMAALFVLKQSMALSINMKMAHEVNEFTSSFQNDQEYFVRLIRNLLNDLNWKQSQTRNKRVVTVDGNSMNRLAKGTRAVDTRLYDLDGHMNVNYKGRYNTRRNHNIRIEQLIDVPLGNKKVTGEEYKSMKIGTLAERRKGYSTTPATASLLDDLMDDSYNQLKRMMSIDKLGLKGILLKNAHGNLKGHIRMKPFPKHMMPLIPGRCHVRVEKLIDVPPENADVTDVRYRKHMQSGGLTKKKTQHLKPSNSAFLLDDLMDDCYSQLKSEIYKTKISSEEKSLVEINGKRENEQRKTFSEHMMPLRPRKVCLETSREGADLPECKDNVTAEKESESQVTPKPVEIEPNSSTALSDTPVIKAVTIYPEWVGRPQASTSMEDHLNLQLLFDENDGTQSDSEEICKLERHRPNCIVVEGEADETSDENDILCSSDG